MWSIGVDGSSLPLATRPEGAAVGDDRVSDRGDHHQSCGPGLVGRYCSIIFLFIFSLLTK